MQELVKEHATFRVLSEMQKEQWTTKDRLFDIQQTRLRALVQSANANVPYYRELFQTIGINVRMFRKTDLPRLPFLTKEIIRDNLARMTNPNARRIRKFSTGGSTGSPLIFFLGSTRVSSDVAARIRAEGWFGTAQGDSEFAIWGSPVELTRQDRVRELRDWILGTRLLSAFDMNAETMSRYLDEMQRRGCRRVFGYPSSIALLCEHARQEKINLHTLGVKAVFVTAEYLYEHWRTAIAEAFGCPVANGYGGRDSGFVAHECPARGMHITADRLIVEIVDEQGRPQPFGQSGEIIVTNFDTPEMPFIRYRTGDVGVLTARNCSCGRTLPLLERIDGRKTDFIVAPDGRVMHGLSLIYVMREIAGIKTFRITQERLTSFKVEIVRDEQYEARSEDRIRKVFAQRLKAPVEVRISYQESIPPTPSGKTRHIISEVNPPGGTNSLFSAEGAEIVEENVPITRRNIKTRI